MVHAAFAMILAWIFPNEQDMGHCSTKGEYKANTSPESVPLLS
jgi:hypothetical protein